MVHHVGRGGREYLEREFEPAAEIGHQDFDARLRRNLPHRANAVGEMPRAAIAQVVAIDPCGYPGLALTQTRDLGIKASAGELGDRLAAELTRLLAQHERRR